MPYFGFSSNKTSAGDVRPSCVKKSFQRSSVVYTKPTLLPPGLQWYAITLARENWSDGLTLEYIHTYIQHTYLSPVLLLRIVIIIVERPLFSALFSRCTCARSLHNNKLACDHRNRPRDVLNQYRVGEIGLIFIVTTNIYICMYVTTFVSAHDITFLCVR